MVPEYNDEMIDEFHSRIVNLSKINEDYKKRIVELSDEVVRLERNANKPVRELTDDDCNGIWDRCPDIPERNRGEMVRWMVNEYIAKQSEPDEIPFDQAKFDEGGWDVKVIYSDGMKGTLYTATKVTLVRK